jgi:hypothetical protein
MMSGSSESRFVRLDGEPLHVTSVLHIHFPILMIYRQSSAEKIFKSLRGTYPRAFMYPSKSIPEDAGNQPSKSYHPKDL